MTLSSTPAALQAGSSCFTDLFHRPEFRQELEQLWGPPREICVGVLKSHRRRCTFEIAFNTERGWHRVIGKAYARDRSDILQAMDAFGRAGFGPEADFSIPQPLAHVSALGVRLEERVEGTSAKEVFLHGNPHERIAAAERCAGWLARFQVDAPPLRGKVTDPAAQVPRWQGW